MNIEAKKTEKLASALYLLTSFFADLEPMKWRLRELGGRLVSGKESRAATMEIMGLLTVAKNAGLVSEMNYGIIYKEFEVLLPQGQTLPEIFKKTEEKEVAETKPSFYLSSSLPAAPVIKDKVQKDTREPVERIEREGVVALKKNSRQNIILSILKRKKEIMIKDVTPLIEGVSEKTIQRELLSLVSKGILRKVGEKRWSRYSLAD